MEDFRFLIDIFPGLENVSETQALHGLIKTTQDTDRWTEKSQKIDANYERKRQEHKVNDRMMQKTRIFQRDQTLETVFSDKIKSIRKKSRQENVQVWKQFRSEQVEKLSQENKEFLSDLQNLQKKWSHLLNIDEHHLPPIEKSMIECKNDDEQSETNSDAEQQTQSYDSSVTSRTEETEEQEQQQQSSYSEDVPVNYSSQEEEAKSSLRSSSSSFSQEIVSDSD
jgi:hypothetical protein